MIWTRRLSSCACPRSDVHQVQLPDFLPAPHIVGMGKCTTTIVNEFAVRPDLVRRAIAQHQTWIEQQLGVSLSDVVILESDLDIVQIGIELLLANPSNPAPGLIHSEAAAPVRGERLDASRVSAVLRYQQSSRMDILCNVRSPTQVKEVESLMSRLSNRAPPSPRPIRVLRDRTELRLSHRSGQRP